MNSFFTRKWYEYIYSEWKDYLPKICYLRYTNDYEYVDETIFADEYDLNKILIDKFEKYFFSKKKYIDSYSKLEKNLLIMKKLMN